MTPRETPADIERQPVTRERVEGRTLIHKLYDGPSDALYPLTRSETEVIARALLAALDDLDAVKAWKYCPECGDDETRHEEGVHKQCKTCGQEWFSDLDYSDVVRKHLAANAALTARCEALREELAEAAGALDSAGAELSEFANILSRDPWQASHAYESAVQARAAIQTKDTPDAE